MVGPVGFEPTTSSTRTRRSTKLSHGPKKLISPQKTEATGGRDVEYA